MVLWMVLVAVIGAFSADSPRICLELVLVVDGVLAAFLVTVLPLSRVAARRTRLRAGRLLAEAGVARPVRRARGGRRTAG